MEIHLIYLAVDFWVKIYGMVLVLDVDFDFQFRCSRLVFIGTVTTTSSPVSTPLWREKCVVDETKTRDDRGIILSRLREQDDFSFFENKHNEKNNGSVKKRIRYFC